MSAAPEADLPRLLQEIQNDRLIDNRLGGYVSRYKLLSAEEVALLHEVSTATLCSQLMQRGLRNCFLGGLTPLGHPQRMVGHAYTLRYVPAREDLGMSSDFDNSTNPQRLAVEDIGPGEVLVIDARGDVTAGSLGSILATRIAQRGAVGLVTDGAVRDSPFVASLDLPAYTGGQNARLSSVVHHPVDRNVPIGCAGVLVMPGDVLVGDSEGVVVLPNALAADIAYSAYEQEKLEDYVMTRITAGEAITGVYPPDQTTMEQYHASRSGQT